ncbi:MAG: DUF4160 domain-containing protein [Acidimicrobiia bacterium]|nr:DUF4160 domain-containing protein [Acidimicrobiia bacterium]
MPEFDSFNGIKFEVYNGDHGKPHVHTTYAEFKAKIFIESLEVERGYLPNKKLKLAKQFITENEEDLIELYYEQNPDLKKNENSK